MFKIIYIRHTRLYSCCAYHFNYFPFSSLLSRSEPHPLLFTFKSLFSVFHCLYPCASLSNDTSYGVILLSLKMPFDGNLFKEWNTCTCRWTPLLVSCHPVWTKANTSLQASCIRPPIFKYYVFKHKGRNTRRRIYSDSLAFWKVRGIKDRVPVFSTNLKYLYTTHRMDPQSISYRRILVKTFQRIIFIYFKYFNI